MQILKHFPQLTVALFKALQTPILIYIALIGNFITFSCAYLFYLFEQSINPDVQSFFDAVWWSFCTVTTVGFGDIVPLTTEGRIIAILLMLTGIVFFIGFTAILVSVISALSTEDVIKTQQPKLNDIQQLKNELAELRKVIEQQK